VAIRTNMSRKGSHWDNAAWEPFMETLEHDEVFPNENRGPIDAKRSIERFLEKSINEKRLPSRWATVRPPSLKDASPVGESAVCSKKA